MYRKLIDQVYVLPRHVRRIQNWSPIRSEVRLRFRCTGCGKCCTGRGGRVRVNDRELEELAIATNLSITEFKRKYTRLENKSVDGHNKPQLVLKQLHDDSQCVFLQGSKCSVYQARPTPCRTFPWWPQHLVSNYDWHVAAADCEGIHLEKEDETVPVLSFDDVLPETIVHDIHKSGENYTYEEMQQLLHEITKADPDVVMQYKAEFVAKYSRQIVFNDDNITVFDSFLEGTAKPTRSFVFKNRLHLIQSEVALDYIPNKSEPEFDRTTLVLEVHRAFSMALAWLPKRKDQTPLSVGVVGAGACTLPLFLLKHFSRRELGRLDAIEPNKHVNEIGRRFFGVDEALHQDARLQIHEITGEEFLLQQENNVYDLLVLDVEDGGSTNGVVAPPIGMLALDMLHAAKKKLLPGGILAINVITESEVDLSNVEAKLHHVFLRGLRLSLPTNTIFFLINNDCGNTRPFDVMEYIKMIHDSAFQRDHALTPALLATSRLTTWTSTLTNA